MNLLTFHGDIRMHACMDPSGCVCNEQGKGTPPAAFLFLPWMQRFENIIISFFVFLW